MDEKRLAILISRETNLDDALGMIASNYIDIGGDLVGLTVNNAVKAFKFLIEYQKTHSLTTYAPDTKCW